MLARAYSVKINVIFGVGLKDEKLIKEQAYMKNETCTLYSGDFWIFLPKIIKIDYYNSELYRFKVDAFFEAQRSKRMVDTLMVKYGIFNFATDDVYLGAIWSKFALELLL